MPSIITNSRAKIMTEPYSHYTIKHMENVTNPGFLKGGLSYTLRSAFSAIPAAIGHTADTILLLDGIGGDKDSHFAGPFGFVLGLPFWLLGAILGELIQIIINTPSYLAYYLLDMPISLFSPNFNKAMKAAWITAANANTGIGRIFGILFEALGVGFRSFFYAPHKEMDGVFGFTAGAVPEIGRYIVHRILISFTSIIQFTTDNFCSGIRAVYSGIYSLFVDKDKAPNNDLANEKLVEDRQGNPEPEIVEENVKVNIIQAAPNVEVNNCIDQGINLFKALGITREEYQNDPATASKKFRLLSREHHADKRPADLTEEQIKAADEQWNMIQKANSILSKPKSIATKKYLSAVKRNPGFFGENANNDNQANQNIPEQEVNNQAQLPVQPKIVIKKRQ